MPFFTVIMSRIMIGDKHSWKVYLSLLPIVTGVAVATVAEVSFDVLGLSSALLATAGFSIMNIFSKKVLKETGVHHLRLLCTLGRIACLMFLPLWLFVDCKQVIVDMTNENTMSSSVLSLLVIDGILHWLQNILAFTILKMVAPLTYAVANVTKRISIISVSLILLKNHVTTSNVCGMLMAIGGVFYYNKVKYEENKMKTTLPSLYQKVNHKPQNPLLWNANASNSVKFVSPMKRNDFTNNTTLTNFESYSNYHNSNTYSNNHLIVSKNSKDTTSFNGFTYSPYPTRSPSS